MSIFRRICHPGFYAKFKIHEVPNNGWHHHGRCFSTSRINLSNSNTPSETNNSAKSDSSHNSFFDRCVEKFTKKWYEHDDFEKVSEFFDQAENELYKGKGSRFPRTHQEESESEYKINFELPGMSKSDVSIHWKSGNTLVLTANKQVEEVSQDKKII
ncbi:hypothetical protein DLAC_03424 [Tieghemostelium lacteum]|uniref:SHSP domain-containing protein n=1 Tax=Tieghemostelium lacteum TaxID=361077 RepID=A0A152A1Y4_TIELA|nr:hypothetical protein DLAC_03424 [Tieghemostelium lacteum]|eukprot:KYR00262.1 hypothetical protein DLAC_03424 [Tieghemostelium lacteum]